MPEKYTMTRLPFIAALLVVLGSGTVEGSIVYSYTNYDSLQSGTLLSGTIEISDQGQIGVLEIDDIINLALDVTKGGDTFSFTKTDVSRIEGVLISDTEIYVAPAANNDNNSFLLYKGSPEQFVVWNDQDELRINGDPSYKRRQALQAFGGGNYLYDTGWIESDFIEPIVIADRVNPIPEPTTLAIWSILGGIGLVVGHRRRRRKAA